MSTIFLARRAVDEHGRYVKGAICRFYEAGTNFVTPLNVYHDFDLTLDAGNYIKADGAGKFKPVYLDGGPYAMRFEDSKGEVLCDIDHYAAPSNVSFENLEDFLASTDKYEAGEIIRVGHKYAGYLSYIALEASEPSYGIVNAAGCRFKPPLHQFWPEYYGSGSRAKTSSARGAWDGVSDDSDAFEAWALYGKTNAMTLQFMQGSQYAVNRGIWFGFTDTAAGLRGFQGNGAVVVLTGEGQRGFDFSGVGNGVRAKIGNFTIETATGVSALYAWMIARPRQFAANTFRSSGNILFEGITTSGSFYLANRVNVSSESNVEHHCFNFQNRDDAHSSITTRRHIFANTAGIWFTGEFNFNNQDFNGENVTSSSGGTGRIVRKPKGDALDGFVRIQVTGGTFLLGDTMTGVDSGLTVTITNEPYVIPEDITFVENGIEGNSTATLMTWTDVYNNITSTRSYVEGTFISDFSDIYIAYNNANHANRPSDVPNDQAGVMYHIQADRTIDQGTGSISGITIVGIYQHFRAGSNWTFGDDVSGGGSYSLISYGMNMSTGSVATTDVDGLNRVKYVGADDNRAFMFGTRWTSDYNLNFDGNIDIIRDNTVRLLSRAGTIGTARLIYNPDRIARMDVICSSEAQIGEEIAPGIIEKPNTSTDFVRIHEIDTGLPVVIGRGTVLSTGALVNARGDISLTHDAVGDYTLSCQRGSQVLTPHASPQQPFTFVRHTPIDSNTMRLTAYRPDANGTYILTNSAFDIELRG